MTTSSNVIPLPPKPSAPFGYGGDESLNTFRRHIQDVIDEETPSVAEPIDPTPEPHRCAVIEFPPAVAVEEGGPVQ